MSTAETLESTNSSFFCFHFQVKESVFFYGISFSNYFLIEIFFAEIV